MIAQPVKPDHTPILAALLRYTFDLLNSLAGHSDQRLKKKNIPGLESSYKQSEILCRLRKEEELFDGLQTVMKGHCQELASSLKSALLRSVEPLDLIGTYWSSYTDGLDYMAMVHLYLDRSYLLIQSKSIKQLGFQFFRNIVASDAIIKTCLVDSLFAEITKDRQGIEINEKAVEKLVRMHFDLDIYFLEFEVAFLEMTREFYTIEAASLVVNCSVSQYMIRVEQRLEQEYQRCTVGYLDAATRTTLVKVVEKILLTDQSKFLLDGFGPLAKDSQIQDLARLYSLFERTGDLSSLKAVYGQYIEKDGLGLVMNPDLDKGMIDSLLNFQSKLNSITSTAFNGNIIFTQVQKEAFASFLNKRKTKPSELIALYIDKLLKSTKDSDNVESKLVECLNLFRLVDGKDVFEAFYGKSLAKRLLLNKSASVDAEKSMLVKLKSECGSLFTSKLEGMFKDMDLSNDIMSSFQDSKFASKLKDMEMNVNILTASYWPTYPQIELNLPEAFVRYQDIFKEFYTLKHNGRRISWAMSLGHCIVHYQHPNGMKDLVVSLFQTMVLLLFNTQGTLTTDEVQAQTGLEEGDLERTLQSLSLGKVKLLKKTPYTRDVKSDDKWEINSEFTHPQRRIVVNSIQAQETPKEIEQTTERVFEDRAFAVDACIVRIMKTKKKVSFRTLVSDVFEALKFPMEMTDLKKRIESLIERDYMERDANDSTMYTYVA